jgi:hypothetical protein
MKIGRLVKVDIRNLWYGEASHFTPWLASEENIALISEAIDLELELVVIVDYHAYNPLFRALIYTG